MRGQLLIFACLILFACDNTLDIAAPRMDIPVVHGILAPFDTAHYIRVERVFIDPERSAFEVARIPDSIYFEGLEVSLFDQVSGEQHIFRAVNATQEGYQRDTGLFATEPNLLYKARSDELQLRGGDVYELDLRMNDGVQIGAAVTTIVGAPSLVVPRRNQLLRFDYDRLFRVAWQESVGAALYDVRFPIRVVEFGPSGIRSIDLLWVPAAGTPATEFEFRGVEFYRFLADRLEANSAITRELVQIDLEIRAGGREIAEFIQVSLANTGITSAGGELPRYTNIDGGVGILSSSHRDLEQNFELHPATVDSLRFGSITAPLNFR